MRHQHTARGGDGLFPVRGYKDLSEIIRGYSYFAYCKTTGLLLALR